MRGAKGEVGAGIHNLSVFGQFRKLLWRKRRESRQRPQYRRSLDVVYFHLSKVGGYLEFLFHLTNETLAVFDLQVRVLPALQSDGGPQSLCDVRSAGRAGAMGGADDDMVSQGEELVEEGVV